MAGLNPIVSQTPTNDATSSGIGALAPLESSDYDFSTTRYPQSVGTADAPHYMIFNINLPTNSRYVETSGGSVANVQSSSQNNFDLKSALGGVFQGSGGQVGATAAGAATIGAVSAIGSGDLFNIVPGAVVGAAQGTIVSAAVGNITLKPKLTRVKKAIAIYMPDTIVHEYNHSWNSVSLTEALGQFGTAAAVGGSVIGAVKNFGKAAEKAWDSFKLMNPAATDLSGFSTIIPAIRNSAQGQEMIGAVAEAAGAGKDFTALALRGQNAAINPQVEMAFMGTTNRQYQFVFDFQPRSAQDTADIQDIIKTFKMYAAPEINIQANQVAGSSGRYFIPPAQFDISFYFNNTQNKNIANISTCALTQIMVNYNQAGQFATFADGQPVHINMTLQFTEMDIITRELIDVYGY